MNRSTMPAMVAILTAKEGEAESLHACLQRLVANSRAEAGMVRYDLHKRTDARNQFVFYEVWQDVAAFEAHKTSEFMIGHRERVEPFLASVERIPLTIL